MNKDGGACGKAAYGNSPRAAVAFVVRPLDVSFYCEGDSCSFMVCGPTHCQTKPNLGSSARRWTWLLWRWRDCDFVICHLDGAARFFEKRSVPTA